MPLTDIDAQRLGDSVADKLGNRNLIINGAMNLAQRGTTSSSSTGYCSLDRFTVDADQGAWEFNQEDLSSGDPYNLGFRHFARLKNTTVTTNNGRRRKFMQLIEAQNVAQSGWNYTSSSSFVTFSFWVRSSVAGTYYFSLQTQDQSPQKAFIFGKTLVANTWTKVEQAIPGDSSLVVNNDIGSGLRAIFSVDHGTTFTGSVTLDQWGNFNNNIRNPDTTTGWSNTLNATFDVTGVQLEVGNTATPFEHVSFGDELHRCKRYFEKRSFDTNTYEPICVGTVPGTSTNSTLKGVVYYEVVKRVAPTITSSAASTFRRNGAGIADAQATGLTINQISDMAHQLEVVQNNQTSGYSGWIGRQDASTTFINYDAEL